jgi:hypothetical protein
MKRMLLILMIATCAPFVGLGVFGAIQQFRGLQPKSERELQEEAIQGRIDKLQGQLDQRIVREIEEQQEDLDAMKAEDYEPDGPDYEEWDP